MKRIKKLCFFIIICFFPVIPVWLNENSYRFHFDYNKTYPVLGINSNSDPLKLELNKTWSTDGDDEFKSMVIDSGGNIYVVGMDSWDIVTIKYNSSLEVEWNRTYTNAIGQDSAYGVALDSDDNVYVVCKYAPNGATHSYMTLLKYNNSGDLKWMRNWGGTGNVFTSGRGIVIDSEDNIYLAGHTNSLGAGGYDICLVKYNTTGDEQWFQTWGGTENEECRDIAIDNMGNLFVVGYTQSFGAGNSDALILKYNSTGSLKWYKTYGNTDIDLANSVAIDSSNDIYYCGITTNSGGYRDTLIVKYNTNGNLIWTRVWGDEYSHESGYGINIDDFNQIYITTSINQPITGYNIEILSYSIIGEKYWEFIWGTDSFDLGSDLAYYTPNQLYLVGTTTGMNAIGEDGLLLQFSIHPVLTIASPNNNSFFSSLAPSFQIIAVTHYLDSIWYSMDNGITNNSVSSTTGALNQSLWDSLNDGDYELIFYANDSFSEVFSSNITINKDTTDPISEFHYSPYTEPNVINISTTLTISSFDGIGSGIDLIYYRINDSSWTVIPSSTEVSFTLNPSSEPGYYKIDYYAIDNVGNIEDIKSITVKLIDFITGPPAIPGYHLIFLISSVCLTILIIKKKKNFI